MFADGPRLIVLHSPVARDGPPDTGRDPEPEWLEAAVTLVVENRGDVFLAVTSHFHFFETSRALRFDRAAAWGMHLAVAPGVKVAFAPRSAREVRLAAFAGGRVIRGHGCLVDGRLDDPQVRAEALALARERGYADISG